MNIVCDKKSRVVCREKKPKSLGDWKEGLLSYASAYAKKQVLGYALMSERGCSFRSGG
jgi:hypothetical protein